MKQIPSTNGLQPEVRHVLDAVKENIEQLRGIRGEKINTLTNGASQLDIIQKINDLINRIQG